jgi:hypothetical protein
MERWDAHQSDAESRPSQESIPAGWTLMDRSDGPEGTTLRFAHRDRPNRAWVTANGSSFEEAWSVGVHRVVLYEEIERYWRRHIGLV